MSLARRIARLLEEPIADERAQNSEKTDGPSSIEMRFEALEHVGSKHRQDPPSPVVVGTIENDVNENARVSKPPLVEYEHIENRIVRYLVIAPVLFIGYWMPFWVAKGVLMVIAVGLWAYFQYKHKLL